MKIVALSYQFLPNIILILAILGVMFIIVRRLPEAVILEGQEPKQPSPQKKLLSKGLPAAADSKIKVLLKFWGKKFWNFALEAKDLKPTAMASYQIKKIFGDRFAKAGSQIPGPLTAPEAINEQYWLNVIKNDPKNPSNYDALGKFYLDRADTEDARDIYQYLTQHEPQNADYHAKLAYCCYQLKDFSKSAESYQKSLALDSSQPNRYYNLGLALEAGGKTRDAEQAIIKALNLEPNHLTYYLGLSLVYEKLGEKARAIQALEKAKQLDPLSDIVAKKLEKLLGKEE